MLLPPPSSGRRWRAAPEIGFALISLRPTPCPSGIPLPWEGGRCLSSRFSLLPLEGGGAQRRRLASLSFAFGQPLALRASPFHGKGGDGLLIPFLPPSSGRRWRVAPEVSFALFRLQPTPALRASPFHGKGVDGLLIPLLPPFSGRRWRIAPEVGFALFRLRPTPCPSGIPLPWEGGRWITHP